MNTTPDECQVCHHSIADDTERVICPECGAPYHKTCYDEQGYCTHELKHGDGFEYVAPTPPPAEEPKESEAGHTESAPHSDTKQQGTVCSRCGTVNAKDGIFCENCGAPLRSNTMLGGAQSPFGGFPQPSIRMDMQGEIDGVPTKDWATYIGPSAPNYVTRLVRQQIQGGKTSFTLSAFFFSSLYFAYRKMWSWAALATLTYVLLAVPSVLLILAEASFAPLAGVSISFLTNLNIVASYLSLARQILFSIFALYLYRKNAGKRIRKLRTELPAENEYQAALAKKGGVSWLGVVGVIVAVFALYLVLYYFTGDALLSYFMELLGDSVRLTLFGL